jgi:hypothetical protein
MKLTDIARGKPCMIRLIGICNRDPETTVFCHVRIIGLSGAGLKAPDFFGSFGCSACHAVVDGQVKSALSYDERKLALLEGMVWTLAWFIENGYVAVKGEREQRVVKLPKILPRRGIA